MATALEPKDQSIAEKPPSSSAPFRNGTAKFSNANHTMAHWLTHPANLTRVINVPLKKIQVGQVWKKDDSGDTFLITKVYNEALTTFALLRKTGSEDEPPVRVKVTKSSGNPSLPGFSYTQESDDF